MDKGKIQELREFFERRCSHLDPLERQREAERLTDSIRGTVEHLQEKERCRQRDAKCIKGALRKIDLALEELDDVTGPEAERMREALHKLRAETGSPVQKDTIEEKNCDRKRYRVNPTERSYIDVLSLEPKIYTIPTYRKTTTEDQAEFLFKIWAWWIRESGEEPSTYEGSPKEDNPFFELAGILLDIEPKTARRQWFRAQNPGRVTK